MWIRSQDDRLLIDADKIFVSKKCDSKYEIFNIGETYNHTLGFYSSLDKAMRVMDEIQGKIECPYPSRVTPAFSTNCYHLSEKVQFYDMPQDDEVEV